VDKEARDQEAKGTSMQRAKEAKGQGGKGPRRQRGKEAKGQGGRGARRQHKSKPDKRGIDRRPLVGLVARHAMQN
jgi:hypothetical protein